VSIYNLGDLLSEAKIKTLYDPFDLNILRNQHDDDGIPYTLSQDYAKKKATEKNLAINVPDAYTLQLDIDTDAAWELFIQRLAPTFIEHVNVARIWWTVSNGGNKHVYIRLKQRVTVYERIAFQAALGSDPMRELLSALRVRTGNSDMATLFFEKQNSPEIVIYSTDGYQPQLTSGEGK
jgi:hypothetical protein